MYYHQLFLVILLVVQLLNANVSQLSAVKITTSKPTLSNTSKTVSNATKKFPVGTGKVITTRLATRTNAEKQCQCTEVNLCDRDKVVSVSSLTDGNNCPLDQVCCAVSQAASWEGNKANDQVSAFTLSPVTSSLPSCVCTPTHQCIDYDPLIISSGAGLIDPRFSCDTSEVCCPRNQISNINTSSPPSIPTVTSRPNCICVPSYQCTNYDPTADDGLIDTAGAGLIDERISCGGPDVCCPSNQVSNNGLLESPKNRPTPNLEECGIRRQSDVARRILSPEDQSQTFFGEFPWMALILTTKTKNSFVCGASLLSPSIVLTAAHCLKRINASSIIVRVGEYNINSDATEPFPHQERPVSFVRVHPDFNSKVLFNNLALLVLSSPFDLATHISPICVPMINTPYAAPDAYDPNQCMATGWGKNAFEEGSYQSILRKVDLSIVPRDRCQSQLRETRLGPNFELNPSFICAGGKPGFDTCQGDGGGPLFCASRDNPSRYILIGVTSWGIGCGGTTPAVYASLEANKEWLTTEFNSLTVFGRRGG